MDLISRLKRRKPQLESEFKRLTVLLDQCKSTEAEWHERAMQALGKKRDDLARQAIVFKLRAQKEAAAIENQIAALGKRYLDKLRRRTTQEQEPQASGSEPWVQLEKIVRLNKDLERPE